MHRTNGFPVTLWYQNIRWLAINHPKKAHFLTCTYITHSHCQHTLYTPLCILFIVSQFFVYIAVYSVSLHYLTSCSVFVPCLNWCHTPCMCTHTCDAAACCVGESYRTKQADGTFLASFFDAKISSGKTYKKQKGNHQLWCYMFFFMLPNNMFRCKACGADRKDLLQA